MINQHLTRWINASVDKYFIDRKGAYPLYLEGTEADLKTAESWAELRKVGPVIIPQGQDGFEIQLVVNILCGNKKDFKNAHKIHKLVGYFQSLMDTITIYRYGNTVGVDDDSIVGCMDIRQDVPRPVDTINWGVTNENLKIENVSIEAFYKMHYYQ